MRTAMQRPGYCAQYRYNNEAPVYDAHIYLWQSHISNVLEFAHIWKPTGTFVAQYYEIILVTLFFFFSFL